jgi:type III secretory pathway component EscS
MKSKITHLIISLIFAVIIGYMASVATLMIIPITGYIFTAIAKIMDNNFNITIRILCWMYTVLIALYLRNANP